VKAPGADEDEQGETVCGCGGQLADEDHPGHGIVAGGTCTSPNILKCRPDTPGQTSGKPEAHGPPEMETCIPYSARADRSEFRAEGAGGAGAARPLEGLLHKTGIMKLTRGQWHEYRGIPLMPNVSPRAYLLRNQAMAEKAARVGRTCLQVMEKLGMPVSEKASGNFFSRRRKDRQPGMKKKRWKILIGVGIFSGARDGQARGWTAHPPAAECGRGL